MRLFVILPVAVLVISSMVLGLTSISRVQAAAARRAAEPRTGMEILNAYECGRGETKRIIVRGVEDDYSPAGEEPGFIREGRNHAASLPSKGEGQYDQVNADQGFTDSFKLEGRVTSGVFLIRLRTLNDSDNDHFSLGDLSVDLESGTRRPYGGKTISEPPTAGTWMRTGDILHGDIDRIPFVTMDGGPGTGRTDYSLKTYLNDSAGPGWLDVFVQDDTAVDFMGLALCYPPAVKRGVTLMPMETTETTGIRKEEMIHLTCHSVRDRADRCDPYVGNQVCSAMLPVACLRPGDAPPPGHVSGRPFIVWSGGDIAVTEPVRPDRFRSVRDVEAFCAERFGPGWRVANLNDGYRFQGISGLGDPRTVTGPVWVDAVGQPHATCWKRE